jgi:hypothetical protein
MEVALRRPPAGSRYGAKHTDRSALLPDQHGYTKVYAAKTSEGLQFRSNGMYREHNIIAGTLRMSLQLPIANGPQPPGWHMDDYKAHTGSLPIIAKVSKVALDMQRIAPSDGKWIAISTGAVRGQKVYQKIENGDKVSSYVSSY